MAHGRGTENSKKTDRKRTSGSKRIEKICLNCGNEFSIPQCRDFREHCCSSECKRKLREKKKAVRDRKCLQCGRIFRPRQYQLDHGQGKFCSDACSKKSTVGRKQSKEWIDKRVESFKNSEYYKANKKGRDNPCFLESYIRGGYRYVTDSNGVKIQEHRYVVELSLGRSLRRDEVVHHIDGDKHNNDLSNLMIVNWSGHLKMHRSRAKTVSFICPTCRSRFDRTERYVRMKLKLDQKRFFCSRSCGVSMNKRFQMGS